MPQATQMLEVNGTIQLSRYADSSQYAVSAYGREIWFVKLDDAKRFMNSLIG